MSVASSLAQSVVSLFTYLQNLGAASELPTYEIPEQLQGVVNFLTKFLFNIIQFIPKIPAFDVRAQLIILSLGIPLVLDVLFIWFINPFFDTLLHMIDIIVLIVFTMLITEGLWLGWNQRKILLLVGGGFYIIGRIALNILKTKSASREKEKRLKENKNSENFSQFDEKKGLPDLIEAVCEVYMTGVIPGMATQYTESDLEIVLNNFSHTIQVEPDKKYNIPAIIVIAILTVFSLLVTLWSADLFSLGGIRCPSEIRSFLPAISGIFCVIAFIMLLLFVTQCGHRVIFAFKRFANRWGLRLLMLFLDLLYIPIITNMVSAITPTSYTCGEGYYLQYDRVEPFYGDSSFFMFVNHSSECRPCHPNLVDTLSDCKAACSGTSEWRVLGALNLKIIDDVLIPSGGVLIFTVIMFVIGIPVLWRIIIRRNRSSVKRINVYGKDFDTKWQSIILRLDTTGIFLFAIYNFNSYNWSLILIFIKFFVMIITTLSCRVNVDIYFGLPALYIICGFITLISKPFIYKANHILNVGLYFLNFVYSLLPLFSTYGLVIPEKVIFIVSIGLVVIPILSILFLLFSKVDAISEDDPTYLQSKQKKELLKQKEKEQKLKSQSSGKKENKEKKKEMKRKKITKEAIAKMDNQFPKTSIEHVKTQRNDEHVDIFEVLPKFVLSCHYVGPNASAEEKKKKSKSDNKKEEEEEQIDELYLKYDRFIKDAEELAIFNQQLNADSKYPNLQATDDVEIQKGYMDSIEFRYHVLNQDQIKDRPGDFSKRVFYEHTPAFYISKRVIYNRVATMYGIIDQALDGATIALLTKVLNYCMLLGAVSFGWYLGTLMGQSHTRSNLFCG